MFLIRITDKFGMVTRPIKIKAAILNNEEVAFDFDDDEITLLNPPSELQANIISEHSHLGNASDFVIWNKTKKEHTITILKSEAKGDGKIKITGFFDDERVHAD